MTEKNLSVFCKNITKTYCEGTPAEVKALRGINLSIPKGQLHMLMGPSGSGKTTLISVIAGILSETAGECLINGINLNHLPDQEKAHYRGQNIGFVFQAFNLIPMLTTEENVSIPLLLNNVERNLATNAAKEMLKNVGLEDKIGKFPADLSGGQGQRVAIARAIVHSPEIIVCDEPTSYLDHETGHKVMELLHTLMKKSGATLIVVTHDQRIVEFADAITHLDDGRIVEETNPNPPSH